MKFSGGRKGFRSQLIRSGTSLALIQVLSRVLVVVIGIVLARALGPSHYGIYVYAFAILSFLKIASELGIPMLMMREVASSQAQQKFGLLRGVISHGIPAVLLISVVVMASATLVLWLIRDKLSAEEFETYLLMLAMVPFSALITAMVQSLIGLHRPVLGQGIEALVRPLLMLALIVGVFGFFPGLQQPQVAMLAQLASVMFVLAILCWSLVQVLPLEVKEAQAEYRDGQWLRAALPFTLIGGASLINSQADVIMIGWFRSNEEVGLYRVATQGGLLVAFGLQIANSIIAPHFARFYSNRDIKSLQRLARLSARVTFLMALLTAAVLVIGGGFIIKWVFGAEYVGAHLALAIIAFGQLFNAACGSVAYLLNMTGRERDSARTLCYTALLNIVLNLILVPTWGIAGAATSTALSLVIWNIILFRLVRQHLRINPTAFGRSADFTKEFDAQIKT